ncbi:hypothetical protein MKW92_032275 [Papaver armeniacum]|nr:hypothetical protein MKW92_032275 [Papaver armeniacum]
MDKRIPDQNLANEDSPDGAGHRDKRVKEEGPRPYLTPEVLYDEASWKRWALTPFDLTELIEMRNKGGNLTFIHVASIYEENGVSGFGYIIRDCHGTPIVAYSEYVTNEIGPVSEFYLQMMAVDKSLEHAEKLGIKYVSMITTSCEVAFAVRDCYLGEICVNGKKDDKVTAVSDGIIEKLSRRRHSYPNENHIYFHIHPDPDGISFNSAVCLVGLEASGRASKLEFLFHEVREKMPVGEDKLDKLMKHLYEDASYESVFHP